MTYEAGRHDPRWDHLGGYRDEDDPAIFGVGAGWYGQDIYAQAGVPEPMVPGLQPWQLGEPEGQLVEDDWRAQRFAQLTRTCGHCGGTGDDPTGPGGEARPSACGWCNGTGEVPA